MRYILTTMITAVLAGAPRPDRPGAADVTAPPLRRYLAPRVPFP